MMNHEQDYWSVKSDPIELIIMLHDISGYKSWKINVRYSIKIPFQNFRILIRIYKSFHLHEIWKE